MSLRAKARFYRKVAVLLLGTFLLQLFYPPAALALTSGPSQPEFSSFEPISSTEMVDEFTGDFTYNLPVLNVPGPQGSGYSMSLSYHSGASPEEEASWVGYGWTLNPGAINRNTRGFPDDYKGQDVKYYNEVPKNWTATIGAGGGVEIFSNDIGLGLSANASLRYNNYTGFGKNVNLGVSLGKGLVSLGVNMEGGEQTFSASVSPAALLNNKAERGTMSYHLNKKLFSSKFPIVGGNYGVFSYSQAVRPTHVSKYTGESYNYTTGLVVTPAPAEIGYSHNLTGSFNIQENEATRNLQAYGFLYAAEGNTELNPEEDVKVRDYYVEKETPYSKRDVFLGVPFNNADNFMVTGEGVVGGFRLYHKTPGIIAKIKATYF